jgi:twinkle protein
MVLALGCRDIFLDHLTALAASIDDDERKAIDKIMAELGTLVQQLDITIHYISHLATPEGKSHEEGGRVQERHFRGSRSIAYWSNFLFGLERDKQNTEGVTTFRVLKDRYTGDANGVTFGLAYDRERGRMVECELASNNPFKDGGEF